MTGVFSNWKDEAWAGTGARTYGHTCLSITGLFALLRPTSLDFPSLGAGEAALRTSTRAKD